MAVMKANLISWLQRRKIYWQFKNWFLNVPYFAFWKYSHLEDERQRKRKSDIRLLRSTLVGFILSALYAVVIFAVLESYHIFVYQFTLPETISSEAIDTFLGAVASIAGVFIGLYFTAISSIASSLLVNADQDVKNHFFTSPHGVQYVKTIEITGILSLYLLVAKSLGHLPHPASLIFLLICVSYIVLRFWKVSSEVYNFIEPSTIFPRITKKITDSVKSVRPPSNSWNKNFLQNYHRQQVVQSFQLAEKYLDFGINKVKLNAHEIGVAVRYLAWLFYEYSRLKSGIPTKSLWFKTKYQYGNWALADDIEKRIAIETGTSINPKTVINHTWFEEQLTKMFVALLKNHFDNEDFEVLYSHHEIIVAIPEFYGERLDVEAAKKIFEDFFILDEHFFESLKKDKQNSVTKGKMAFVDSRGRVALSFLLGFAKYLDTEPGNIFLRKVERVKWREGIKSVYTSDFPIATIERMEVLASELSNEFEIEGKLITAEWYKKTYSLQRHQYAVKEYFEFVKNIHQGYFNKTVNKLIELEQYGYSVQLLQRWLEFTKKYTSMVHRFRAELERCAEHQTLLDLPWPEFNMDEELDWALSKEKTVSEILVLLLPRIQTLVTTDEVPDYFSHALRIGIEECYEACADNDHERFARLFPVVLNASIIHQQRTRDEIDAWGEEESKIIYSTEPLVNLFELSGFAILYSELHSNEELRNVVETAWNTYFQSIPDARAAIGFILAIHIYRHNIFKIMPDAYLRAAWQQRFNHEMAELGLRVFPDIRQPFDDEEPAHESELIRYLSNIGGMQLRTAEEVFLELFLAGKEEAAGLEFPNDIREGLERQRRRQE
ncbi:hypothetical protein KC722_01295 [Candidatus Kaiserbacteria bacterium]|nr:hypothetical protein [Candidatus Kaiserbacteria bacterium]MCB9811983.1 hypothetical protein [Candidatus Nomurabacteria bacterium]